MSLHNDHMTGAADNNYWVLSKYAMNINFIFPHSNMISGAKRVLSTCGIETLHVMSQCSEAYPSFGVSYYI